MSRPGLYILGRGHQRDSAGRVGNATLAWAPDLETAVHVAVEQFGSCECNDASPQCWAVPYTEQNAKHYGAN